ncbi:threonine aspartase 1-like isoform X1 [Mytilus galloprovincialis]|uniref:threonine aspartase 1-like isoform X1 n=1 Tax=Mytilus galloprovincialis TaxID=29158 RepID=UPI003F7C5C0F
MIAIHAGAGYHSESKSDVYKSICKPACLLAIEAIKCGKNAVDCVTIAVKCLEDSPNTNAGIGSNLTMDGTVECDASVMDGLSLQFGAVGCVQGFQNPVEAARLLVEKQKQGNLSLGRIPPSILVGNRAEKWILENEPHINTSCNLITDESKRMFLKYKRRLELHEERVNNKRRKIRQNKDKQDEDEEIGVTDEEDSIQSLIQDTVGAIAMDTSGNLAAAVSSGGIALKQPGRLGPAATYGSGCWAYNWSSDSKPGVAIATSGSGEHLMKTLFSKECASCIQNMDSGSLGLSYAFKDHFLESEFLKHLDCKFGGAIALRQDKYDNKQSVELIWGHTTDSMCIGFMSLSDKKPKVFLSRLPPQSLPGKSFTMEGRQLYK